MPVYRPPAFIHRFIETLHPPWSEGRLLSLPTRLFLTKPREGLRQGASPMGGFCLDYCHDSMTIIIFFYYYFIIINIIAIFYYNIHVYIIAIIIIITDINLLINDS